MTIIFLDTPWILKKIRHLYYFLYCVQNHLIFVLLQLSYLEWIMWIWSCLCLVKTQNKDCTVLQKLFALLYVPVNHWEKSIIALLALLVWGESIKYLPQSIPPVLKQIVSASLSLSFSINDCISSWEQCRKLLSQRSDRSFSKGHSKEMSPFIKM